MDTTDQTEFAEFLKPTWYLDFDTPIVADFVREHGQAKNDIRRGRDLYYAVRDAVPYDPYAIELTPESYKASYVLEQGRGYCVQKAILLAAAARGAGIPARVGLADVKNHIATKRLLEMIETDIFYYHGYAELYLSGQWVKATPAFNETLCEKFGIHALEFDGTEDSLFHPYDKAGRRHMEYLADHGTYPDVPFEDIRDKMAEYYPKYFRELGRGPGGDFAAEAEAENR